MDTIFVNSENSKTSDPQRLLLNLPVKINLRRSDKFVALSNLNIYYTWKNKKKTTKFYISAQTWNKDFELTDESYSVLDFQYYFEYIFKKHGEKINNLSIGIYVNKTEDRITFKKKTRYYPKLLTPERMKLLGSTKNKITKYENRENMFHLEITKVVLLHSNIVNNDYHQDSRS